MSTKEEDKGVAELALKSLKALSAIRRIAKEQHKSEFDRLEEIIAKASEALAIIDLLDGMDAEQMEVLLAK